MSLITILCRLVADKATLRYLWELMADKYTPLINELLEQLAQHPDFETWLEKGEVPKDTIKTICNSLKIQDRFADQPGRFYTSAVTLVKEVYKSWFTLQQRRQRQIKGKERWLNMLKSDIELQQESQCNLDIIRAKATEVLISFVAKFTQDKNKQSKIKKGNKTKKNKKDSSNTTLFNGLFDIYEKTEDCLSRCALAYLLKNKCQVSEVDEDPEQYAKSRRKKEIEIERLRNQINSRKPKGRDLTGEKWLETLSEAVNQVPRNEDEAKSWQAILLKGNSCIPYPVDYETNTDLTWLTNDKGRIFVKFNGLNKLIDEPKFEVYCDSRQFHYFQRFCQDWQIWHDEDETYSSGLFILRSARLLWQEQKGTKEPWETHHLILQCSVETRLWTQEETELVRLEKINKAEKTIQNMEQKGNLSQTQLPRLERERTQRRKLNNPFPGRPSKPLYQGKSHILVGVSLGLDKPATVAVVDAANNKVLTYRSVKQLLGDNYNLLNRQRQQQQRLSHERHKAQKQNAPNSSGESELGQYVDRLLADAIVAIAKTYFAGSIVLPKLRDMREIIQSEIQTKAEKKIPGYKEGQQNYAKDYRVSVHRWSYGRLIESIQTQAAKSGIYIESGSQPIRDSQQEQARELALFAYQQR
ncbi:type V CRISPR-associated protein Cas12k [Nostoc sp. DedQUE07]|uniref:type V CRISPR-associated protein Cas12k n=1 Tax=Nostoc sp. DedQUE07 TaxID=3075392 RepID=UPI002AD58171|nr:type V CRISPR-associated protein Cas12k [Nostoc sp. DedQUE07]MDZ8133063.1 type V CRISPR-associated protein Cas12k [Nostoc sp. DedQUE07]